MNKNKKGDRAELMACAWLLGQGYEVFRNVSCNGPVDVVATKDDSTKYIDVKYVPGREAQTKSDRKQQEEGIEHLYVTESNISFTFKDVCTTIDEDSASSE